MKIVLAIFLLPMFRHPFGFENLHLKSMILPGFESTALALMLNMQLFQLPFRT